MNEPGDDMPFKPARPDATCAHHPEREAVVRCGVCDREVCFGCFFPEFARCQRCIERAPADVAEPVPFEAVGGLAGFTRTIAAAFSPRRTAPSFALGESLAKPLAFFLLTFLPLAFVRGIIPNTFRLHFSSLGRVLVTPGSTPRDLIVDVIRAGSLSVVESLVQVGAFALCYVSLSRAFGRPEAHVIALRSVGYRAFLIPLGGTFGILPMLLAWLGPNTVGTLQLALVAALLPFVPLVFGLHRSVRSVGRVDSWPGVALALVPMSLYVVVSEIARQVLAPLLPSLASI